MKRLPAAKTLVESGLLFEINRRVLHPRGLALEVIEQDDGTHVMSQELQDWRDEGGIEFGPESIERGEKKLAETELKASISPGRREELAHWAYETARDFREQVREKFGK